MSDEWDVLQDYDYVPSHSPYANSNIRPFHRDHPLLPISEHGGWFPEAPSSWPHGFLRIPEPVPMATRPRMIIQQFSSSPMFPSQFNTQSSTGQSNSRLMADEQAAILKKLRKDTYNPSPRRFSRMVGMFYRNQNSAHTRFDPRDDGEDSKRCAVCLEDFESGEEVTITPCDHMFHEICIVPWIKDQGRCPICRFSLHERETPQTQASRAPETVYHQWEAVLFVPPQRLI